VPYFWHSKAKRAETIKRKRGIRIETEAAAGNDRPTVISEALIHYI
jgi:hypothetical protein